jgi:hypothetical protein
MRLLKSVRVIVPCLLIAGAAEYKVCHIHPDDYTENTTGLFALGWAICSIVLAWLEPRMFFTYCGSVALAAPMISYSMLGYGGLEMGGWFHALSAGGFALIIHAVFNHLRARKAAPTPPPSAPEAAPRSKPPSQTS